MNASSSGTSRQFSGTMTAPSLAMAKKLSMNSTEFIISNPTRSPGCTPRARSAFAVRLMRGVQLGERERGARCRRRRWLRGPG